MIALYFQVKKEQSTIQIQSSIVAKQSSLYLFGLYWCYLFPMINNSFQKLGGRKVFATALLAGITLNLQGVWFLLVYRYFHIKKKHNNSGGGGNSNKNQKQEDPEHSNDDDAENNNNSNSTVAIDESNITTNSSCCSNEQRSKKTNMGDEDHQQQQQKQGDEPNTPTTTTSFTFNIFDGTCHVDPNSPFANYIFDGDSDDEYNDQLQSQQWDTIQDHV